jgi:lipocalin
LPTFFTVQQQAENTYTSRDSDQCVTAQYVKKGYKTFWGYDIGVYNVASNGAGDQMVGELCASVQSSGKLKVAPCFLPKWSAGPYWIVDYQEGDDDEDGYALISGGQPKNLVSTGADANTCGKDGTSPCCKTGDGVNNSGLWIFTRQKNASAELVNKVRTIAKEKGFATSVLFDVTHPDDCDIPDIVGSTGKNRALLRGSN